MEMKRTIKDVAGGDNKVQALVIKMAFDNLSRKQKRRMRLYFYFGYMENEIARIEGVPSKLFMNLSKRELKPLKGC